MRRLLLQFAFIALAIVPCAAAGLGPRYDSYRDLHQATAYGSLFFNEGAIRYRQSRQLKRFVQVTSDGVLDLPPQAGYCFVFNHYDDSPGPIVSHVYRATITKTFADGGAMEEPFAGTFTPTAELVSSDLPDLCISGTHNVTHIAIAFTSDDGTNFDWRISFSPK